MKEFIKEHKGVMLTIVAIWFYISLLVSITWGADNCDKDYPIKYLVYTNLLCEIK